jgi:excisionase family DNA binding protein
MAIEAEGLSIRQRIARSTRALTAAELAELLGMSPVTILRKAKKRQIPSLRIGGSVRFCPKAVSEWLGKQ